MMICWDEEGKRSLNLTIRKSREAGKDNIKDGHEEEAHR